MSGGSGSNNPTPTNTSPSREFLSSEGFATAASTVADAPAGTRYETQLATIEGDDVGFAPATLQKLTQNDDVYVFSYPDGGVVTIAQNVRLTKVSPFDHQGVSTTRTDGSGSPLTVNMGRQSDINITEAQLLSFFEGGGSGVVDKVGVIGASTDPSQFDQVTGSVTYEGDVFVAYRGSPTSGVYGTAGGDVSIEANFQDNTLTGVADLDQRSVSLAPSSSDFLEGAQLSIEGAMNSRNGFEGTVSLQSSSTSSSMTDFNADMKGAFFGSEAAAVGGTLVGSVNTSDAGVMPIVGGFVAQE
ncbi:transferrin-binding protein-like solute binding protein [Yoonia sp. SS1-5]|uniref:Transferrin-binding protein-like solute binding protein n=1 Tax=Yoonia rhodophyticola TaxID=3137370 RepID=A0AAN0NKJ5_9RHOB